MNFGLESIAGNVLYGSFLAAFFLSIFWRPVAGILYLIPLLPLQTTRDSLGRYPLGGNIVLLILLAVVIGLLRRKESLFPWTPWKGSMYMYCGFLLLSYCAGSFYLGYSFPLSLDDPRLVELKDYLIMPLLLLLAAATITEVKHMKIAVALMCLGILMVDKSYWGTVSGRDFSSYSEELRDAGAMGYAGSNGLGAFGAQCTAFCMVLGGFERKFWLKAIYFALAAFSGICLMLTFSRGGYVAVLAGWLFIGVAKQRKMLALLILFGMFWASLVPPAVSSRIFMTHGDDGELDHSAETRITLWEDAMLVFNANPVTGSGYNTYAYMGRVGNYKDTHNYFLKVMVETGVVGLLIFLWFLWSLFWKGCKLSSGAQDPFLSALGFSLAAWMVCVVVGNCFGDRWNYLQVNGYMWVLGGMVARGWMLEQERGADGAETAYETADAETDAHSEPILAV